MMSNEEQKEAIRLKKRIAYQKNKEKIIARVKKYREENKKVINENLKKYREINKEKLKLINKEYRDKNRKKLNNKNKTWCDNNKTKRNESRLRAIENNPFLKFKLKVRGLIKNSIHRKNYKKKSKTVEILGCSFEEFRKHIQSQFESWMDWDNYGNPKDGIYEPNKTWDIDHIIPISHAITENEVIKLNHYTNLRPLCSYNNRWVKRNK